MAASLVPVTILSAREPRGIYLHEIGAEFTKLRRNRTYTLSVIGFPVIFYLMFSSLGGRGSAEAHAYARYLLAGYSCFGAMGAALFGIGNGLAYERGHGWLELKRASPMPPMAYLMAKLAASLVFSLTICLLLSALGPLVAGHSVATPFEIIKLLGVVAVGTVPFASLGLLSGLMVPPNAVTGLVNMVYLPLSFCGGLWMPIENLPQWLQGVAHYLPSYWFSRLALHALGYATPSLVLAYAVLAGYTAVLLALSARVWAVSEAKA